MPDLLKPDLDIVFVGINPGERSARLGHYYAGIGNQFWELLYESGLTPRKLSYHEDRLLLWYSIGLTDVVKRPSRSSSEISAQEFNRGRIDLERKLLKYDPRVVCFNGITGFSAFFGNAGRTRPGLQNFHIGRSGVFLVPSTSSRNKAHYSFEEKRRWFIKLRELRDHLKGKL